MTISNRVNRYLASHDIPYQVIPHFHSVNSLTSADSANVPLQQVAKAVMLSDHEGRMTMAVLPGNNKISLSTVNDELLGTYKLVKEQDVYKLFTDCEHGAIPPVADAYNMGMICDKLLDNLNEVYLEAGDHENLLCIDHEGFEKLTANAKHLRFSHEVFH